MDSCTASLCAAPELSPMATDSCSFVLSTTPQSVRSVPVERYLRALEPAATDAVRDTLGQVPEVAAVLWAILDTHIRVVTILVERSDVVLIEVAKQELALMDRLKDVNFEFRTAPLAKAGTFMAAGYTPVLETESNADA